jgi:hypothetical protein
MIVNFIFLNCIVFQLDFSVFFVGAYRIVLIGISYISLHRRLLKILINTQDCNIQLHIRQSSVVVVARIFFFADAQFREFSWRHPVRRMEGLR